MREPPAGSQARNLRGHGFADAAFDTRLLTAGHWNKNSIISRTPSHPKGLSARSIKVVTSICRRMANPGNGGPAARSAGFQELGSESEQEQGTDGILPQGQEPEAVEYQMALFLSLPAEDRQADLFPELADGRLLDLRKLASAWPSCLAFANGRSRTVLPLEAAFTLCVNRHVVKRDTALGTLDL